MRSVVFTMAVVAFFSTDELIIHAQETATEETATEEVATEEIATEVISTGETATEEHPEYAKLKVLEPLVGKYRGEGVSEATNEKWESELQVTWSDTKKMLVARFSNRFTSADGDLTTQIWKSGGHHYYLWSQVNKRIEFYQMRLPQGIVNIRAVEPQEDGTFVYPQLSTSASPAEKADMSVTVDDKQIAMKLTNYVAANGEPQDDVLIVFERIE